MKKEYIKPVLVIEIASLGGLIAMSTIEDDGTWEGPQSKFGTWEDPQSKFGTWEDLNDNSSKN